MLDFVENDNNDIEFNGKVIVRGYDLNDDDFARFSSELRNATRQHKVSTIYTLDGHISDVEDFINYERSLMRKINYSKLSD